MASAKWSARKGRSSSWIRKSTRFKIYARDHFDCVYCRLVFPPAVDGRGLTLDHVIPRSEGGSNAASNLVTACLSCNSQRQDRPLRSRERRSVARAVARVA